MAAIRALGGLPYSTPRALLRALCTGVGFFLVAAAVGKVTSDYQTTVVINALMFGAAATGWSIADGLVGRFSAGHAAMFGAGAYTWALLVVEVEVSAVMASVAVIAAGLLVAWFLAIVCVRFDAFYFAVSTLAFAECLRALWRRSDVLTGVQSDMVVPAFVLDRYQQLLFVGAICALSIALYVAVVDSRLGLRMKAVRDDPVAAAGVGLTPRRYQVIGVTLSGVGPAAAGSFYAWYFTFVGPDTVFSIDGISLALALMAIVGGRRSRWGGVVGALAVTLLIEQARQLDPEATVLVYGLLLIATVRLAPKGLIGLLEALRSRFRGQPGSTASTVATRLATPAGSAQVLETETSGS